MKKVSQSDFSSPKSHAPKFGITISREYTVCHVTVNAEKNNGFVSMCADLSNSSVIIDGLLRENVLKAMTSGTS